jgi:micrococcal nuclease
MFEYDANLIKIIDGDTLDADIDLGFEVFVKKRIRLFGINAPETRTKDLDEKRSGLASKRRLEALLGASNGKFILKSHGVGKYGRCLGEIFIDNVSINNLLIKEGLAEVYK